MGKKAQKEQEELEYKQSVSQQDQLGFELQINKLERKGFIKMITDGLIVPCEKEYQV